MSDKQGFVKRCLVQPRPDQDGPIFWDDEDGNVRCGLEGYAVIPIEDYATLKGVPLEEVAHPEYLRGIAG